MMLFIAYNGWTGNGAVHCHIIANSEEDAQKLAKTNFYNAGFKEAPFWFTEAEKKSYAAKYSKNIEVELLCEDTSDFWVGEVLD